MDTDFKNFFFIGYAGCLRKSCKIATLCGPSFSCFSVILVVTPSLNYLALGKSFVHHVFL